MGKYYSPSGNFEVWKEKPQGYYTEQEWAELHPTPPYVPTKAEKLATLEAQYEADKKELIGYFTNAMIANDDEEMAELREEIAELEAEYNEARKKLEEAE